MLKKKQMNILKAAAATTLTLSMALYPEQAFQAALDGLIIWWEVVFPALLPFFTAAEILMGLGAVHFMGAMLEPLMRPIFKVPGVGAFALAMGFASGYPIGAKITGTLRREQLCTQIEGERLVSFTNTADPLFMVGAVAVGLFAQSELGIIIAGAHYISCILLGLILRFHGRKSKERASVQSDRGGKSILKYALYKMHMAREKDGRDIGQLLGDSIMESINTLLLIGGFIILFSVITEMFKVLGLAIIIQSAFYYILNLFSISENLMPALLSGLFEISNGTKVAASALAPIEQQLTISGAIIAWSGFSVHAQVASMINDTDLRMAPYIISRVIHSILAALVTIFLMRTRLFSFMPTEIPVFFVPPQPQELNFWIIGVQLLIITIIILLGLTILSLLIQIIKNIKLVIIK